MVNILRQKHNQADLIQAAYDKISPYFVIFLN